MNNLVSEAGLGLLGLHWLPMRRWDAFKTGPGSVCKCFHGEAFQPIDRNPCPGRNSPAKSVETDQTAKCRIPRG